MSQLFSNNVDTQLSAPLTDVGTSASVADGSKMNAPTGGDYELLTLISGANVEIVSMTARSGNTITITRAQEGTTAIAWGTGTRVFAGITAATLSGHLVNQSGAAGALALGGGADAAADGTALGVSANAGADSVGVGNAADAGGAESVAVGVGSWAPNATCVAVGQYASALGFGADSAVFGANATAGGASSTALGANAVTYAATGTAVGARAEVSDPGGTAIGADTYAVNSALALGREARAPVTRCSHIAALPIVTSAASDASDCHWKKNASEVVIMSAPVDLTATGTHTITMPSGVTFYPDEVGVIVTDTDTVTGQPTVRFGATGAETRYLAATETVGLTAVRAREKFATLASDEGSTTLAAEITIAGAATTLTGQFYWRGFAVQQ